MKTALFIVLSFAFACQVKAQEQTLLSGPIENGGFGGPVVKFSQIDKKFAVFAGGYGGWLINHTFLIGGGGYGLVNNIHASRDVQLYYGTGDNLRLDFGYGGLMLEYIGIPNNMVHFSVSTLIGGGGVGYSYINDVYSPYYDHRDMSACFVLEPGLGAELNVTRFFRINAGAGYRLVRGTDMIGVSDSDLSDFSASLTFKFGKF